MYFSISISPTARAVYCGCISHSPLARRLAQDGGFIAVLRYVEPLTGFLERSIFASGGLKPYLRSGKPCGLDQPGDPSA